MKHSYHTLSTSVQRRAVLPLLLGLMSLALPPGASAQNAWINEFHYDNAGGDTGEFVEVAVEGVACNDDVSAYSVVLYNGNGGASYDSSSLDAYTSCSTSNGVAFFAMATTGLQNGSPDGIALAMGTSLIQFLSYEGSFTAVGGIADGIPSTEVSASESGTTPIGSSLQLVGTGSAYADFTWSGPSPESPGAVNADQTLAAPPEPNNTDFLAQQGNPGAECSALGLDLLALAKYEFDDMVFEFGGDLISFDADPPSSPSGSWTATVPVSAFLFKQASGAESIAYWAFNPPYPAGTPFNYVSPFTDYSHITFCGPPPGTCEATTVLDEFVSENGQTYLKLTFSNAQGIEEIDFTLFDNLAVHNVMPTPQTQNLGDAGGPVMTFNGETSVMIWLTRQDGTNSITQYMGVVTSTGATSTGAPCVTEFDPVRTFPESTPAAFELSAAYPNPFNPQTTIRFALPEAAAATLTVYDVMGRQVTTLATGSLEAGVHTVTWTGTDAAGQAVASGVYLYRLEAGGFTQTRSMLLLK